MNKKLKVAIIGGGFTGLTAAYELLKNQDVEVTLIERGSDLGGLASGFKIQGTNLEKTYHHIFKTDTDIIDLVKEIGIEDKLEWNPSLVSIYYKGKIYKFGTPISLLLFKPLNFFNRIRVGVLMLFLQKYKNWRKFVKVPAFEWIKKWSGKQATEVIWEPLLRGKFSSQYYDKISMAWLWARLHIRANSQERGGEKLGYFNGGFNVIVEKLQKLIEEKGGRIMTSTEVKSITSVGARLDLALLRATDSKAENHSFDKIIFTGPSHVFAKILEANQENTLKNFHPSSKAKDLASYLKQLNSINYLGAVCMVFSSDQDLSDYYWHNINDTTFPFLVFINHTKMVGKERYNGKNIYYLGAYIPHDNKYFEMDNEELKKLWFNGLKRIFPQFNPDEIGDFQLLKAKNAQHIVTLDFEENIPEYKTPIKNLYLSNFSQIFPEDRGTNYAVREGRKIAKLVLD